VIPARSGRFRSTRPDHVYALAWTKAYGKGRVFQCGLGHHRDAYRDKAFIAFYLAAAQYALGDLAGGDK